MKLFIIFLIFDYYYYYYIKIVSSRFLIERGNERNRASPVLSWTEPTWCRLNNERGFFFKFRWTERSANPFLLQISCSFSNLSSIRCYSIKWWRRLITLVGDLHRWLHTLLFFIRAYNIFFLRRALRVTLDRCYSIKYN